MQSPGSLHIYMYFLPTLFVSSIISVLFGVMSTFDVDFETLLFLVGLFVCISTVPQSWLSHQPERQLELLSAHLIPVVNGMPPNHTEYYFLSTMLCAILSIYIFYELGMALSSAFDMGVLTYSLYSFWLFELLGDAFCLTETPAYTLLFATRCTIEFAFSGVMVSLSGPTFWRYSNVVTVALLAVNLVHDILFTSYCRHKFDRSVSKRLSKVDELLEKLEPDC